MVQRRACCLCFGANWSPDLNTLMLALLILLPLSSISLGVVSLTRIARSAGVIGGQTFGYLGIAASILWPMAAVVLILMVSAAHI